MTISLIYYLKRVVLYVRRSWVTRAWETRQVTHLSLKTHDTQLEKLMFEYYIEIMLEIPSKCLLLNKQWAWQAQSLTWIIPIQSLSKFGMRASAVDCSIFSIYNVLFLIALQCQIRNRTAGFSNWIEWSSLQLLYVCHIWCELYIYIFWKPMNRNSKISFSPTH